MSAPRPFILLIRPNSDRLYPAGTRISLLEPLGLEYLAAAAGDSHTVIIVDLECEELRPADLEAEYGVPVLIGVTVTTPLVKEARDILHQLPPHWKNQGVVVGGPHFTGMFRAWHRPPLWPDEAPVICAQGQGENWLRGWLGLPSIDPLSLFPDRFAAEMPHRLGCYKLAMPQPRKPQRVASVFTSRGCPYRCNFCAAHCTFGHIVQFRTAEHVLQELEELREDFGVNTIIFVDDCFTLRKRRVLAICAGIRERGLDFDWWIDTRCDTVDPEVLAAMAEAGCKVIVFGVESGNQDVQHRIGKMLDLERAREAFRDTCAAGIHTKANFILGHLDETEEEIQDTLRFAREINADRTSFYLALPLPGSQLYDVAVERKVLKGKFEDFGWYLDPVAQLSKVPTERLKELHHQATLEFGGIP